MIATGMDTRIGEIAKMMASEDKEAADHPTFRNFILPDITRGNGRYWAHKPSSLTDRCVVCDLGDFTDTQKSKKELLKSLATLRTQLFRSSTTLVRRCQEWKRVVSPLRFLPLVVDLHKVMTESIFIDFLGHP